MKEMIFLVVFLVLFGIAGTMEYNDLKAQNDELKAKAEQREAIRVMKAARKQLQECQKQELTVWVCK